jgi:glycerol-3-phosphate dehydrogenase
LVVASPDEKLRLLLQSELSGPRFRLYTNSDLSGNFAARSLRAEEGRKLNIEMPIVEKMYAVLYEDGKPEDAIHDLMERKLKEE